MYLPYNRKSFQIDLAVLIQYRHVTDSQPPSHVAKASTRYAYLRSAVKTLKSSLKSANKRQRNACLNYAPPSNEQRSGLGALFKKKHIFAPTAGARYTIFRKTCAMIELVETIKKMSVIF